MLNLITDNYVNRLKWRREFFLTGHSAQAWKETANVLEKNLILISKQKKSTCLEEMFNANWFQTGETRVNIKEDIVNKAKKKLIYSYFAVQRMTKHK